MEDTLGQLEDQFWETNGTCGRQLEGYWGITSADKWKTTRQQLKKPWPQLGNNI